MLYSHIKQFYLMHEKRAFYIIDLQRKICQQIKKQKHQGCAQLKFEGKKKTWQPCTLQC